MARTFSGTANTDPATLTISGKRCKAVRVRNTDTENNLLVRVPRVTGDDFDVLVPGTECVYVDDSSRIADLFVKTASASATYTAGVVRGAP